MPSDVHNLRSHPLYSVVFLTAWKLADRLVQRRGGEQKARRAARIVLRPWNSMLNVRVRS